MQLVLPDLKYEASFLSASAELRRTERADTEEAQVDSHQKFIDYIDRLLKNCIGERLRLGFVASTEWWLIDKGKYIGRIGLRHELENDYLKHVGGHIGYVIRPSKRKLGYGTKILQLGLQKAAGMGYEELMITCDEKNLASRKIIEVNGGRFQDMVTDPTNGHLKRRYTFQLVGKSSESNITKPKG